MMEPAPQKNSKAHRTFEVKGQSQSQQQGNMLDNRRRKTSGEALTEDQKTPRKRSTAVILGKLQSFYTLICW